MDNIAWYGWYRTLSYIEDEFCEICGQQIVSDGKVNFCPKTPHDNQSNNNY